MSLDNVSYDESDLMGGVERLQSLLSEAGLHVKGIGVAEDIPSHNTI